MKTNDVELKIKGYKVLEDALGEVMAERFIALVGREDFDYTKWQRKLLNDVSVNDLSKVAMKAYKKSN
jgi:hypothetical protein